MRRLVVTGCFILTALYAYAQDGHPSKDIRCKKCSPAYDKALAYVLSKYDKSDFSVKFCAAFLFLADGRYPNEIQKFIAVAKNAHKHVNGFNGNWYVAMAALFLSEYYRLHPSEEIKAALIQLAQTAATSQEETGGWNHHKGFGKKYCADDLAVVTGMLYSAFWNMKLAKIDLPAGILEKTDKNLLGLVTPQGLNYGTRDGWGETTGSRIGFASLGLLNAEATSHKIVATGFSALPSRIPKLNRGHGTGAIHLLSVVLACHRFGPSMYENLTKEWLDKLIAQQAADGSILIGDDKAAGGEMSLMGSNVGSTAGFALLLLLQDPSRLKPAKKAAPGTRSTNPFSQKK